MFAQRTYTIVIVIVVVVIIIIIIIMKSSVDRVITIAITSFYAKNGFAITLYYHPAECDVVMVVYRLLCGFLIFFGLGRWSWLVGRGDRVGDESTVR
jgi:hypothetical protein